MITAALILYALGALTTMSYLMDLVRDIPGDELSWWQVALAAVMAVGMALAWPVFWGWLIFDMWRE